MNRIKRLISITLIIFLIIGRTWPTIVLAEEVPVEEPVETQEVDEVAPEVTQEEATEENNEVSPTPTPEAELDNDAEVTNEVDSTAITGKNEITEPTPTPTSTDEVVEPESTEGDSEEAPSCQLEELEEGKSCPEPTPTIEPDLEGQPEATDGESLDNSQEEDPAIIDTDDAISTTVVENSVNTTEVNSEILYQTLNIFVPGDVDLTMSPLDIAANVLSGENNNEPVVNVMVLDAENVAYLSNDIVSFANTGDNQAGGISEALITTGDAYSVVSLLNKVNTTIIGSTIHIVTINIFGNVDGNILLPEFETNTESDCCAEVVHIGNTAVVENNVDSEAVSGQNTITTTDTENASITTENASSVVNIINIVNTSLIGVVFHYLYISSLGTWVGDFLGWDSLEALAGGGSLALSSTSNGSNGNDCPGCVGDVSIGNEAYVTNNISSTANTGGNSINGQGGTINTGNAYSSVSIINFINSSIISSTGFFGFINIFGFFEGDIGGASLFAENEEVQEEVVQETSEGGEPGQSIRAAGGQLDVYQYNNVGTHVLPGDTVTFFVTVRNPGTGTVYDVKLRIILINDEGLDVGGGEFNLGDIKEYQGVKVTTGMVLSEDAVPGNYIAHAEVLGYVGPDDTLISAYSDSLFKIAGFSPLPLMPGIVEEVQAIEPEKEVLGVAGSSGLNREDIYKLLFLGLTSIYLPATGYRKRREIGVALTKSGKYIGSKSVALRSFMASFLA